MKYDVAHLSFGKHVEFGLLDTEERDTYLNVIIWQSRWPETADSVYVCKDFHQREVSKDQTWSLAQKR